MAREGAGSHPPRPDRARAVPLSLRLVLTYALLVAATLLVVAGLVLQLSRNHLRRELEVQLSSAASSFQRGPARSIERPADVVPQARQWLAVRPVSENEYAAVRSQNGRILLSTGGLDLREVNGGQRLLDATESRWWQLDGPEGQVRALTVPLMLSDRQVGTLVVGASEDRLDDTLSRLSSGVTVASLVGLVFATLVGAAAVRRTMSPLGRMSEQVDKIQETGDLSHRVSQEGPLDEVGRLGVAFDRLLGRLDEAFASQRRFLSDASHELRTPLTIARGQLELLEQEIDAVDQRRSLGVALEELDRMRKIVEDLLLLARLDEGISMREEVVEVELVVREALLRGMLVGARSSRVEVPPQLQVVADPDRLLQVLTNLITNAVEHAGEQATISITARDAGERVVVEVSDDGPGIAPADLPHVFDRLYRGAGASAESPSGAGLGLSIVASLTRAMGGEVDVTSTPGEGTTFSLSLRRA